MPTTYVMMVLLNVFTNLSQYMSNKKLKQIATFLNEKVLMMVTTLHILNYTEFHSLGTNSKIIWPPLSI